MSTLCHDILKGLVEKIVPEEGGWKVYISGGFFSTQLAFFHEVSVQLFDAVWHGEEHFIPEGIFSADSLNDLRYVRSPKHSDEKKE